MGYIARQISTNEVHYSKGADKISRIVGCCPSTITKFFTNTNNKCKDKVIKGWIISKTIEATYRNRGKSVFNGVLSSRISPSSLFLLL